MDELLTYLEAKKEELEGDEFISKHVITLIDLMWAKLDYYYRRSDQTPAYCAAIILHPGKKFHWLEQHWADRIEWLPPTKKAFEQLVQSYATARDVPRRTRRSQRFIKKRKPRTDLNDDDTDSELEIEDPEDEISRYFNTKPIKRAIDATGKKIPIDVIKYWLDSSRRQEFPILSSIALDLAAAPPETSDMERKFSDALNTFTDKRYCLSELTIEALEMLKSGYREGLMR